MIDQIFNAIGTTVNNTTRWITGAANKSFNVPPPSNAPCTTCGKPTLPQEQYIANQNIRDGIVFNADSGRTAQHLLRTQQAIPNQQMTNMGVKFN